MATSSGVRLYADAGMGALFGVAARDRTFRNFSNSVQATRSATKLLWSQRAERKRKHLATHDPLYALVFQSSVCARRLELRRI